MNEKLRLDDVLGDEGCKVMDEARNRIADLINKDFSRYNPTIVLQSVLQVASYLSDIVIKQHEREDKNCGGCEPLKMAVKFQSTFDLWLQNKGRGDNKI